MPVRLSKLRKAPGIVRLHGHRGARGIWPENTMIGFENTLQMGVEIIELDVLLTKDNVPVVTHNPQLMAETTRNKDGQWLDSEGPNVSDLTYAELCSFDIGGVRPGSAYAHRYPEQAFLFERHVPTLDDVAKLACHPAHKDTWLNIEIKSIPTEEHLTPPPRTLASSVVEVIQKNGLENRVIVQSFDWRVLHHIKEAASGILRSHLSYLDCPNPKMEPNIYPDSPWMAGMQTSGKHQDLCEVVLKAGGQIWSPYYGDIVPAQVARAQELGLVVNAWTVNEIEDIDRMIEAGVDGIITDYPGRVQRRLIEKNLNWREDYANQLGNT